MAGKKQRPSRLGRGLSSLMAAPVEISVEQAEKPAEAGEQSAQAVSSAPAIQETSAEQATRPAGIARLEVTSIQPNRHQPRQRFDPAGIRSLAASLLADGMMQPLVVRPLEGELGRFELVAGERRASFTQRPRSS